MAVDASHVRRSRTRWGGTDISAQRLRYGQEWTARAVKQGGTAIFSSLAIITPGIF